MANHEYVPIPEGTTAEDVKTKVQEILAERKFDKELEFTGKGTVRTPFYIGLAKDENTGYALFWLSTYAEPLSETEEGPRHPVVEFRHQYPGDESAWINHILEKELAKKFNQTFIDTDGVGHSPIQGWGEYPRLRDYMQMLRRNHRNNKISLMQKVWVDKYIKEKVKESSIFGDE